MIGAVVGARYKVLSLLGQGATGQVYLAEHLQLGRKEALKVLKPNVAVDPRFVSRFRREARATNRVRHPNIVGVYDFGRLADGRLFLAMEYAEGPALSHVLIEETALVPARAVFIAKQVAQAIRHAHEHGVVHRDIKPANIVLTERRGTVDFVKVLDFGMAKILTPEDGDPKVLTLKGQTFGTPAYMAPEQFRESSSDPRVDIYAAGCVLYELLTGRPPFTGHSLELMYQHEREAPRPPGEVNPEAVIPPELDACVLRCLAKQPDGRFATARDLFAALSAIPVIGKPPSHRRTFRGIAVVDPEDLEVDTDVGTTSGEIAAMAPAELESAETEVLSADALRASFSATLVDLAEALQDAGCDAVSAALAVVQARRFDLRELDGEIRWTEDRLASADRRTAERESSLRFALGELTFDRQQASTELQADLDYQIGELEQRLARLRQESRDEIDMLDDRGVHLAAKRATVDEQLAAALAALRPLVDAAVPAYADEPLLDPAIESYRNAVRGLAALDGD